MISMTREQVQLLALCKIKGVNWHVLAREVQRFGGVERLCAGDIIEQSDEAIATAKAIRQARDRLAAFEDEAHADGERAAAAGATLVTVADDSYPTTLRLVFNLPPFLFVRGTLNEDDLRSVAVVGTRQASNDGRRRAARMARLLVEQGVTVVSGLARGIDTAAHHATLDAGGRTIAVIGTGICRCYPPENQELAERIANNGAVVSQFWPQAPPATYTFPRRNVTMSGIAQGTVVIEASSSSGAKLQARIALQHGKKVFLLKSLTADQPWAQKYVAKRGAVQVNEVDDVVRLLADPAHVRDADARRSQLSLQFD